MKLSLHCSLESNAIGWGSKPRQWSGQGQIRYFALVFLTHTHMKTMFQRQKERQSRILNTGSTSIPEKEELWRCMFNYAVPLWLIFLFSILYYSSRRSLLLQCSSVSAPSLGGWGVLLSNNYLVMEGAMGEKEVLGWPSKAVVAQWVIGGEWLPLHHSFVYIYDTYILHKQYSTFLHFLCTFIKVPHYHMFMRGRTNKKWIDFISKRQCRNWATMSWQK